ncbi:MAG: hypothetical protein ACXVJT_08750 [Thermoanaerobaculia bacterium]
MTVSSARWACLLAVVVASVANAQRPSIAGLEIFGLRHVSEARVRKALALREGDPLPESKEAIEQRVAKINGVRAAHLEGVCCVEGGQYLLWLGVEEEGSAAMHFRAAPEGAIRLPADIINLGHELDTALNTAVQNGHGEQDIEKGRSFSRDPAARAIQEEFIPYAAANLALLREVLQYSSDAGHRALAAQVIAYAPDVRTITADLLEAMRDPSPDVRNDATRALLAIATYSRQHPDVGIRVPADAFVSLLSSSHWTDRNKSSGALEQITADRDPAVLKMLRSRAMPALIEMSRWKVIGYAAPSLRIVGRIGGMSESAIEKAIGSGDRETIIASATHP